MVAPTYREIKNSGAPALYKNRRVEVAAVSPGNEWDYYIKRLQPCNFFWRRGALFVATSVRAAHARLLFAIAASLVAMPRLCSTVWLVLLAAPSVSTLVHNTNCLLTQNGDVKCWGHCYPNCGIGAVDYVGKALGGMGSNTPKLDLGTGANGQAIAVSAGRKSSCALFHNGRIKCWGDGASGQLGYGDTTNRYSPAVHMGDRLPFVDLGRGVTAVAVDCGWDFNCAILSDGAVKCWGAGNKLGIGTTADQGDGTGEMGDDLPRIFLGEGRSATQISCGKDHACAILDNGALKCWGLAAYGRTGNGRASHDMSYIGSVASQMESLGTVKLGTGRTARQVSCGGQHTCVVLDSGQVKCFGHGVVGETGSGDSMIIGFLGIGASTDPFHVRTENSIGDKCVCPRSNSAPCHRSCRAPQVVNAPQTFDLSPFEQSPRRQPRDGCGGQVGSLWPHAHLRCAHRRRCQVLRPRLRRQARARVHE